MTIQQKLTDFLVTEASWIPWLLIGLATGGVAMFLNRVIYLISINEGFRKLKARALLGLRRFGNVIGARRLAKVVTCRNLAPGECLGL